ncbi:glycoside hydrolase family 3 N-terminal domain-containing protein [Methylocapsa palsarum]|uniref:beta-glucosidase n=1 Tax=Methylocapsa palsarum TaxID=1612308 RepID=A0A1I3X072_9HYPH|nr:glycoside hydrolase family 3 N-terminal domain-containing protein [Methylocapsa palsarum]SFK12226.1 beta-glucosidase [Methylocapsa palsarum]
MTSRIDKLLAAMTCEEKIGQLTMSAAQYAVTGPVLAGDVSEDVRSGRVGSLLNIWGAERAHAIQRIAVEESRLKIPLMIGLDVLHGHKTIFPIPLAETAAFDPELWRRSARESAIEMGGDGVSMTFAPMLDIARDPRWGRIAEGPGEDPWVASRYAEAKVAGFQDGGSSQGLAGAGAVAATAKHLCAYGAVRAGLEYASVDVSERLLHEVYLPPFAAAVAAGCAAIMPAFNDLAGVPMTMHIPLLRGWLRREHRFDGVIVSDYNAIVELLRHGVAADLAEAAAAALKAGVDIDMMGSAYRFGLPDALDRGLVTMSEIDECARRVLALKERLGLFEDPYSRGAGAREPSSLRARRELAKDIARRSIVVLTNDGLLPLQPGLRRIALVGPLANAQAEMNGPWAAAGDPGDCVTFLQGLRAACPNAAIESAPGITIENDDSSGIAQALDICRSSDLVILCLGESASMSGEAASRAALGLPGLQMEFARLVFALDVPVVALISSGRPLIIPEIVERAGAVVATWFLGVEAGPAIADVLSGRFNPTGRLPVTWPRSAGQIPLYFASRPTGRPYHQDDHYTSKYIDLPEGPQFYFGHGLSYGHFAIENLTASAEEFWTGDSLTVEVAVRNEGSRAGEQTLFVFVRDLVASVARPILELKGFARIALGPGESGILRFPLPAAAFAFPGPDFKPVLEPGDFRVSVGPSADPQFHLTVLLRARPV